MQKRNTNSFFVFLTSLLKTKNKKGIRYPFFVRKFENKKGKYGIYTDQPGNMSAYFEKEALQGHRGRPRTSLFRTLDTDLQQIGMRLKTRADMEKQR